MVSVTDVGLCARDLQNLRDWKFELQINESNRLTSQGYEDMFSLAERLKIRFPDFFLGGFSSQRFLVCMVNLTTKYEHTQLIRTFNIKIKCILY